VGTKFGERLQAIISKLPPANAEEIHEVSTICTPISTFFFALVLKESECQTQNIFFLAKVPITLEISNQRFRSLSSGIIKQIYLFVDVIK
jgi:hypothetical protein